MKKHRSLRSLSTCLINTKRCNCSGFPQRWSTSKFVLSELRDLYPLGSSHSTAWILLVYFKTQLIKSRLITHYLFVLVNKAFSLVRLSSAHYTFFLLPVTWGVALSKRLDKFRKLGIRFFRAQEMSNLILFLCSKLYIPPQTPMQSEDKTCISTGLTCHCTQISWLRSILVKNL